MLQFVQDTNLINQPTGLVAQKVVKLNAHEKWLMRGGNDKKNAIKNVVLVCNIQVGENLIEFPFCYIAHLVYLKQLLCQVGKSPHFAAKTGKQQRLSYC